jgi:anthranilate synthase component 1
MRARNPDATLIPIYRRIMGDQLTPILAYKKLEHAQRHVQHAFLFESVNNGTQQGRYSFVGAGPLVEIVAKGQQVEVREKVARGGEEEYRTTRSVSADPLAIPEEMSRAWRVPAEDLAANQDFPSDVFTGGWVGYCGYDTVRYLW